MADPVLHLLAGPNGAGKSTLHEKVIGPTTHLEFVNADVIAAARWPSAGAERSYDAAVLASERRAELFATGASFVTETVFSHPSKVVLARAAMDLGYLVTLHVLLVPEALSVARVVNRVQHGGHAVPEAKVRERYRRLWPLVAEAIGITSAAEVYDNSRADQPFRRIARFEHGAAAVEADWPAWTPDALRRAPA